MASLIRLSLPPSAVSTEGEINLTIAATQSLTFRIPLARTFFNFSVAERLYQVRYAERKINQNWTAVNQRVWVNFHETDGKWRT